MNLNISVNTMASPLAAVSSGAVQSTLGEACRTDQEK